MNNYRLYDVNGSVGNNKPRTETPAPTPTPTPASTPKKTTTFVENMSVFLVMLKNCMNYIYLKHARNIGTINKKGALKDELFTDIQRYFKILHTVSSPRAANTDCGKYANLVHLLELAIISLLNKCKSQYNLYDNITFDRHVLSKSSVPRFDQQLIPSNNGISTNNNNRFDHCLSLSNSLVAIIKKYPIQ